MRHFRTTLILAAALAGLLLYTFSVERPRESRRLQTEAQAKRLVSFEVADVVGLTIRTPQGEVTLDRAASASGGGAWQVSRPLKTRADQQAVATVLDRLREAVIARVVEEHAADLALFGLDRPEVQVTIRLAGSAIRLDLGAAGPMESTLFVRKDAETRVLLADLSLKQAVSKTLQDLRDRTIIRFDPERVGSLRLEYQGRRFALTHEGETWRLMAPMTAPTAVPADRNEVGGLLATLRGLTAEGFVDEGKTAERARLSTPRLTVRLGLSDGDRTVAFYPVPQPPTAPPSAAPDTAKVYAVTSDPEDPLFLVSGDVLRRLDKTAFDLRDKTVLALTRSEVKEVTVRATPGQWTLTAKDGGWVVDGAKRAKAGQVSRFLDRLEALRVERFLDEGDHSILDEAAKGLVPPRIEVELTGPGQTRLALLAFGLEERGLVYAKVTDAKGGVRFLMLAREAVEAIPPRDDVIEGDGGP